MRSATSARDLARRLYAALGNGDRAELKALLAEDFQGTIADGMVLSLGGHYDGAEAMRTQFWGPLGTVFAVRAEPDQTHALQDGGLLVTGRYRGTARATGTALDAAFTHLIRVRDGKISALEQVTDTARWAQALAPLAGSPSVTDAPVPI